MNTHDKKTQLKKRLMFVKGDDFYFLAYNMLLLLQELGCVSGKKVFTDHRKLAFLIDFIADSQLLMILKRASKSESVINNNDRRQLIDVYSNGMLRVQLITQLAFALARKNVIVTLNDEDGFFNLALNPNADLEKFLSHDLYSMERSHVSCLQKLVPTLSRIKLNTMQEKFFTNNGVKIWQD